MNKRSTLGALLAGKCPRCRTGPLVAHGPFSLTKFGKVHDECVRCGLRFEREPWFFYGAMYVSYALSVVLFLLISALVYFLAGDPDVGWYIGAVVGASLVTYPLNFRYSRIIYLHAFGGVKYDKSFDN